MEPVSHYRFTKKYNNEEWSVLVSLRFKQGGDRQQIFVHGPTDRTQHIDVADLEYEVVLESKAGKTRMDYGSAMPRVVELSREPWLMRLPEALLHWQARSDLWNYYGDDYLRFYGATSHQLLAELLADLNFERHLAPASTGKDAISND